MPQLLIVSDIFGQCTGLQQLLQDLSVPEQSITVLDPYGGQMQSFSHEQQAYAAYSEPHFDVAETCVRLSQKPRVAAISTPWQHGFMNPTSAAYSETGYQQHIRQLKRLMVRAP